tara:strand:+ start:1341 stop:1547 length:207 start_codon:yes stop_codon:yes gene_type:complete
MKLFKVVGGLGSTGYTEEMYIIAKYKADAITEFVSRAGNFINNIKSEELCERDKIIPTLEPLKEFSTK